MQAVGSSDHQQFSLGRLPSGVNRQMYDQLKQQVQQLRLDQKGLQAVRAHQREAASAALLEQKLFYGEQLQSLQAENATLQQRLKETVERSSKIRQCAERDKKGLAQQVDKLQEQISELGLQHVEELAAKDAAHVQQLHDIRQELEQRQQEWADERQALQDKQAAFMAETEEWSEAEVEAIKVAAADKLQREKQETTHWKEQHAAAKAELESGKQQIVGLAKQLQHHHQQAEIVAQQHAAAVDQLKQQCGVLERRLQDKQQHWEQEAQHYQQELRLAQGIYDAKERELTANHASELDAVQLKVHAVLAKKDGTIAALRAELDATLLQLQQFEEECMN